MKLKNYHFLILLLNFALYATNKHSKITADPKVNIEISNITTNGLVLPDNTISFNGVEDLEIEFDVKASYTGTNSKYFDGLLNCYYYEPNSFDNEIAQYYNNGVVPQYLFQNTAKLQYSNGTYTYINRKKLRFKRSTLYNTGCSIVFRYRTETLTTDISNKLTYKITGGTKTGNEPYKPATATVNVNNISYSDGLPLINNKIIVPDNEGNEVGTRYINLSFNYSCNYGSQLPKGYYPGFVIQIARENLGSTNLTEYISPIYTSGTFTFNNLKIKSSDLSTNAKLRILFNFQEVEIDLNCGIAQSAKPILYNTIANNQTLNIGEVSKPITYNTPYADYTIRDPRYPSSRPTYDFRYVTLFKWQVKTQNNDWTDIPGQTSIGYSPNKTFTENTSYRRIAFYDGQYNISNTIAITLVDANLQNSICCNQNLPSADSQPQEIIGNTLSTNNYTYQWQICKEPTSNPPIWTDIPNATNQNYKHTFTEVATRGTENTAFRRLINLNALTISTSNQINIQRRTGTIVGSTRILSNTDSFTQDTNSKEINVLNIYPNPIIDHFFIEGEFDINNIYLYDSFGIKANIEKKQISINLSQIDVTKLLPGIYILKIDNTSFSKTIIKN
ncbi:T9SS type A sorting domain-containing protein [Flavobacterium sp. MDT1-60]|uniref:T9SS type A sorting domain-containing protein n=1 Tax=Flavobacterium sp. MDT1-60 TaxID=1979344 RepID=UPI001781C651|nr:T9SS type A sorting domain-containing protein [Flavobacterium sp. MDT1-60]QOG04183.1 T9SS type A sorting domain-containing protein [Flavobacterium sp. MDT1-60]